MFHWPPTKIAISCIQLDIVVGFKVVHQRKHARLWINSKVYNTLVEGSQFQTSKLRRGSILMTLAVPLLLYQLDDSSFDKHLEDT